MTRKRNAQAGNEMRLKEASVDFGACCILSGPGISKASGNSSGALPRLRFASGKKDVPGPLELKM